MAYQSRMLRAISDVKRLRPLLSNNFRVRSVRQLYSKYPLLSNAVTYGCLFVGAEVCQQIARNGFVSSTSKSILPERFQLDLGSLKRYAVWGTFVIPPIFHSWYKWLDKAYETCSKIPLNRSVLLKKVALDQFLLTPVLLALFFVCMAAMERKEDPLEECKQKFLKTFALDCCFWLPVQTFNFRFIPQDMRVVFIGIATFVWMNVICYIKSLPLEESKVKHIRHQET